ncbi:MAG: DUF2894 domain-containing protein [Aquabacterium sp.]|nr:DUF2894 domain-containing protein [Aquabacterium sp.]
MVEPGDHADATSAALQALQAQGVQQRDPVRWHIVAALQRRAASQHGAMRQQLDQRLARALADLQQRHAGPPPSTTAGTTAPTAPRPSPLAALLQHIGHSGAAMPASELKAVRQFSATWARLRVDQQLACALARQPDNAGPLNSQRLMLQTLQRLRQLSPAYLQRFMAHADALLWLDDSAPAAPPPPGAGAPRPVRAGRLRTGTRPAS